MANTVIALKKSATPSAVPLAGNLANGELAINYADGKLFYKAANGTIATISSATNSFGTVNANNTLVVADTPGAIVSLVSGSNIDIVGDAINDKITINLNENVVIPSTGTFKVAAVGGDEGGEIKLANAITNSVLVGDIVIDVYQNRLRFYESAGTNRGAFMNLASAASGVGTDLLSAISGTTDATAREWATAAFNKANTANITADLAFNHANAAFITANIAFSNANTVMVSAQAAFTVANSGFLHANAAYSFSNSVSSTANLAFTHANNSYSRANTANITADRAFNHANAAFATANIAFANANTIMASAQAAFTVANASFLHANAVYSFSNAAYSFANSAHTIANQAFDKANSVIAVSEVAPSSPVANTIWWNSGTGNLYVYYNDGSSSQWVQIGGGIGSGATGTLLSRTQLYCNTSSLLDDTSENINVATFKTFTLMKIVTTESSWVRLYSDGDSRTLDESRSINTDPVAGSGLLAEFVTTANIAQKVTPFLYCGNLEDIPTSNIYVRVTNLSGTTATINIAMTIMGLES